MIPARFGIECFVTGAAVATCIIFTTQLALVVLTGWVSGRTLAPLARWIAREVRATMLGAKE